MSYAKFGRAFHSQYHKTKQLSNKVIRIETKEVLLI